MTVATALAALAAGPLDPGSEDYLKGLALSNVAAACGRLGSADRLIRAVPEGMLTGESGRALLLAMRLHARTQDDFYPAGRVHVGALALAGVLSVGCGRPIPLMRSLAAAYEVMCTVSSVYSEQAQRRGMRPSGVFGPLGVAAGTGAAIGLDASGVANAIALAATMSAGTNQTWISGTDEWLLEIGIAARAGVEAALLVDAGFRAAPPAFEGQAGWASAYFDDPGAQRLNVRLDEPRSMISAVAHKPYPVSGVAQVPTHLACAMHGELSGRRPTRIEVRLSPAEARYPGTANRGPFSGRGAALMSVSHCVACGLLDGVVRLERLENPNVPECAELERLVFLVEDESLDEGSATVQVDLNDRAVLELSADEKDVLFPTREELVADLSGLADRTEGTIQSAQTAAEELWRVEPDAAVLAELIEGHA